MTETTRTLVKIGVLLCVAVLVNQPGLRADDESFLNGRYSFSAQGNRSDLFPIAGDHVSRAGTIRFDGNGNVTAARFTETIDGRTITIGGTGGVHFQGGNYTVSNNGLGRVVLGFEEEISSFPPVSEHVQEIWDIALTSGGKGFFLNVSEQLVTIPGIFVDANEMVTISGEALAN